MGGILSEEFQALTDIGEDTLVFCDNCDFSSNLEICESITKEKESSEKKLEKDLIETGDAKTIEEVSEYLNEAPFKLVKTLIYKIDNKFYALVLKGDAFVNEDKTAFVWAEVKKAIKAKDVEDETLSTLKAVSALNNEEKSLKKSIKEETQKLHQKTKNVIEALSDEQAEELLKMKWIEPLISALYKLPKAIVDTLSKKVNDLAKKYSTTLNDLETEIEQTEKDFCTMLDDLTGDEFDMKGLAELKKLLRG